MEYTPVYLLSGGLGLGGFQFSECHHQMPLARPVGGPFCLAGFPGLTPVVWMAVAPSGHRRCRPDRRRHDYHWRAHDWRREGRIDRRSVIRVGAIIRLAPAVMVMAVRAPIAFIIIVGKCLRTDRQPQQGRRSETENLGCHVHGSPLNQITRSHSRFLPAQGAIYKRLPLNQA